MGVFFRTLYCAKGNYEFGISRVIKSLEPYNNKVTLLVVCFGYTDSQMTAHAPENLPRCKHVSGVRSCDVSMCGFMVIDF